MKTMTQMAMVVVVAVLSISTAQAFFFEDFDADTLNPRWTVDKHDGETVTPNGASSRLETVGNYYRYSHIETPIDGSLNFYLEAQQYPYWSDGAGIAVYWPNGAGVEDDTFVHLRTGWYNNITWGSLVDDDLTQQSATWTDSGVKGDWDYSLSRIEFGQDTIKFYGRIGGGGDSYGGDDPSAAGMTHFPSLDIPRSDVFRDPDAMLIVGKGWQWDSHTNPDFDNNRPQAGGAAGNNIMYVAFRSVPEPGTLVLVAMGALALIARRRG